MPSDHEVCPTSIWLSALPRPVAHPSRSRATRRRWASYHEVAHRYEGDLATVTRLEALAFVRHVGEQYKPGGVGRACPCAARRMVVDAGRGDGRGEPVRPHQGQRPRSRPADGLRRRDRAPCWPTPRAHRRDLAMLTLLVDTGARARQISSLGIVRRGPPFRCGDDHGERDTGTLGAPQRPGGGGAGTVAAPARYGTGQPVALGRRLLDDQRRRAAPQRGATALPRPAAVVRRALAGARRQRGRADEDRRVVIADDGRKYTGEGWLGAAVGSSYERVDWGCRAHVWRGGPVTSHGGGARSFRASARNLLRFWPPDAVLCLDICRLSR